VGQTAEAYLQYGYNLGGTDGWLLDGVGEYEDWRPSWLPQDDAAFHDVIKSVGYGDVVHQRLTRVIAGFTEPEPTTSFPEDRDTWVAYWKRRHEAARVLRVELFEHGYVDYGESSFALVFTEAELNVHAGGHRVIHSQDQLWYIERRARPALDQALAALEITPSEPPGWFIAATYG